MSTHRLFAQLAFERALGMAAIDALRSAIEQKRQFEVETSWPKQPAFASGYDIEALAAELDEIVQDRTRDVLTGPGLGVVERGELFAHPEIEKLVLAARDRERDAG